MKTVLFIGLLALTGCSPNMASVIEAMAKDQATDCVGITTPWGAGHISRTNILNGSVSCTQEGMTVKSGPAQ